tara:strand:+ start:657 stop:791 length:135 start_codon:yes stop_codon:yes gene_type:complete
MSEKYWEKKARKLEEQNEFDDQFDGGLAIILLLVGTIVIGYFSS